MLTPLEFLQTIDDLIIEAELLSDAASHQPPKSRTIDARIIKVNQLRMRLNVAYRELFQENVKINMVLFDACQPEPQDSDYYPFEDDRGPSQSQIESEYIARDGKLPDEPEPDPRGYPDGETPDAPDIEPADKPLYPATWTEKKDEPFHFVPGDDPTQPREGHNPFIEWEY